MRNPSTIASRHEVNLWIVPLKLSIASMALFAVTVTIDMLQAYHRIHIPAWITMGGIDDARAILSTMLGCVSTVLALIFSVALLVLSMVANLFGPRLLYRFVQDWVTQTCIGLFMGAFIYVFLCFLVTHKDQNSEFIPQVCLITAWFFVLGAFAFLVFYSHRVATLIQNPDAIGRIVDDVRRVVNKSAHRRALNSQNASPADDALLAGHAMDRELPPTSHIIVDFDTVLSVRSGYLQEIHFKALVEAANRANALIVLQFRPGQFVLEGEVLATVSPASAGPALGPVILENVSFGRHRVLAQDLEFGLAQIVEIAIRALSPAINDTFTGIACVDLLGESLTVIAAAPAYHGRWYDSTHQLRLQVRPLLFARLIKQAFDQIRQAAADNPAVSIRLISTIGRLAAMMRSSEAQAALAEQGAAVWESSQAASPVSMDRADLLAAWRKTQAQLAGHPPTL